MSKQNTNPGETKKEQRSGNLTGFRKVVDAIAKDLWILVLDVVAVNLSYYLILLIRYYVAGTFNQAAKGHLSAFLQFAPIYTVLCVIVFILCRLYNGMWRYAGINDMNRILLASAVTAGIQVGGTLIMGHPMPVGYYIGGAFIQFVLIVMIRFAYRVFLAEKRKIESRKLPAVNVMIVGAGDVARKAMRQLEDSVYRPACVIDSRGVSDGKAMDGVPVLGGTGRLEEAVGRYAVSAVIIADPALSREDRDGIKQLCEKMKLDLQDHTGILANLSGRLPLTGLLEMVKGPVSIRIDGQTTRYDSGMDALVSFNDRYTVTGICAEGGFVRIDLKESRSEAYAGYDAWLQKHKEETGEDVSYF